MSETSTQTDQSIATEFRGNLGWTQQMLRIVYGLFPIIAGIDKFTNILTNWSELLPAAMTELIPIEPQLFMYIVGIIEIIAGIIVLTKTEYGAYLVAAWLAAIAVTQVLAGNYDIAVRDLWIAFGAVALAQLAVAKTES